MEVGEEVCFHFGVAQSEAIDQEVTTWHLHESSQVNGQLRNDILDILKSTKFKNTNYHPGYSRTKGVVSHVYVYIYVGHGLARMSYNNLTREGNWS